MRTSMAEVVTGHSLVHNRITAIPIINTESSTLRAKKRMAIRTAYDQHTRVLNLIHNQPKSTLDTGRCDGLTFTQLRQRFAYGRELRMSFQ